MIRSMRCSTSGLDSRRVFTVGLALAVFAVFGAEARCAAAQAPAETVIEADQTLAEIMAIPAKAIPERLLSEARGVAIIPNVIKIGFIAGAARTWRGDGARQ